MDPTPPHQGATGAISTAQVITCSQGFAQFDKEQRQKVTHLQVGLAEQIREIVAKVDVCPPRNEIKMAMKSIQFDMLNHSNACRCLARAVAELKKKLDLKVDAVPTFTIQLAVHVVEPRAFVPQSGTLKGYTFVDLSKARSRLYRRGFLKSKLHFAAFFKYYKERGTYMKIKY